MITWFQFFMLFSQQKSPFNELIKRAFCVSNKGEITGLTVQLVLIHQTAGGQYSAVHRI